MPVYFIRSDQIEQNQVHLDKSLQHHLRNVLRLKVGERILLVDERPRRYEARVIASHPNPIALIIESETLPLLQNSPTIRLAVALIKKDKMDWLVQKATELGISRLTPIISTRTIIRPDMRRTEQQMSRWEKIAQEAAQQSCRWDIPVIDAPLSLETLLSEKCDDGFQLICAERHVVRSDQTTLRDAVFRHDGSGTVLIGPEGGWDASERDKAEAVGFLPISLGEEILRTETAALAILSILRYEILLGNHQPTTG